MYKVIFLLYLGTTIVLVAANPLFQTIPSQSCPICQQNAYRNIPTNQPYVIQQPTSNYNPYSQANWAQNPVQQTCQQPQVVPTYNNQVTSCNNQVPSSDNQLNQILFNKILSNPALRSILDPNTKLYNQNGVIIPRHMSPVQNQGSVPNVINNYIIVPPELLLNDTKVNHYNKETKVRKGDKRRRNNNSNGNKGETIPNSKKNQESIASRKETAEKSNNQSSRTRNDSRRDGNQRRAKTNQSGNGNHCDDTGIEKNRQKSRRKPKERNENEESKIPREVTTETITKKIDQDKLDTIQINGKNNNANTYISEEPSQVLLNNENNLNLINYQNYERALKQYNAQCNEKLTTENIEPINNFDQSTIQPLKMEERNTSARKTKRKNNGQNEVRLKINAVQRNPQEEVVIQDFQQKFPGIPEDVVRSLLSHLKRQLQDEQLGGSNFNYPGFPMSYDQFYQAQFGGANNNNGRNNSGRNKNTRRKNRRNQNKGTGQRIKNNSNTNTCETTVDQTPSLIDTKSETTTRTTIQNLNPIEVTRKSDTLNTGKSRELSGEVTTELDDFIETTTSKAIQRYMENIDFDYNTKIPELGMEDIVPTIYVNGIIDDYYPDFTANNNAFIASNEEFGQKSIQEDRYHYTTDKTYETGELNRERRKYEQNVNSNINLKRPEKESINYKYRTNNNKEDSLKTYEEIEDTLTRPQEIKSVGDFEKIQFRTPPTLELPDFETRMVDKAAMNYQEESDEYDEDSYADKYVDKYIDEVDKVSTYSKFKTPQYSTRDKPINERRNLRKRAKSDVETVFARSKVVKYGQTPDHSEEITTPVSKNQDNVAKNERYHYETDDKPSIVIAKSVPGQYW